MKPYNELTEKQKLKFDLELKKNSINAETMRGLKTLEIIEDVINYYNMGVYSVKDFTKFSLEALNKLKNSTI